MERVEVKLIAVGISDSLASKERLDVGSGSCSIVTISQRYCEGVKGLGTQATRPESCAGGLPIWRPICGGVAHAYRQTQAQTERLTNQLLARNHHTPSQAAGHEAKANVTKMRVCTYGPHRSEKKMGKPPRCKSMWPMKAKTLITV